MYIYATERVAVGLDKLHRDRSVMISRIYLRPLALPCCNRPRNDSPNGSVLSVS